MNARDTVSGDASAVHAASVAPDLRCWTLLQELVGFDTTSRESNLALIEHVQRYLADLGIESGLTFDDERRKANLLATIPARDGTVDHGGLVLSGHTDVVPVDGQPWTTPPFSATLAGDRIHGRGTADMKGFIAVALAFVPEFLRHGLARPVHFALSYDEEVGCIGVRRLIADLERRQVRPSGCIVGEPTGMQLVLAHKGRASFRCRVRGREAHSSLTPKGVNAVEVACEIVSHLTSMARRFREQGRFDPAYDVPYTTVHTGVIRGGTALNIVPRDCTFEFEFRHLPFDDPDALFAEVESRAQRLLPAMHAVDPRTGIAFDRLSGLRGFETGADSDIASLSRACMRESNVGKVSFGSEAALFHKAGIAAVLCGPGYIAQAHQPDEWVAVDQLTQCEAFMQRLAERLATP